MTRTPKAHPKGAFDRRDVKRMSRIFLDNHKTGRYIFERYKAGIYQVFVKGQVDQFKIPDIH